MHHQNLKETVYKLAFILNIYNDAGTVNYYSKLQFNNNVTVSN